MPHLGLPGLALWLLQDSCPRLLSKLFHLFVYFWLNRVFVAAQALFLLHHWGLLSSLVRRLLVAVASLFVAAQTQGVRASVAALPGLKGTGSAVVGLGLSCSLAGGIFPNQGSKLCLLHQQADSFPLSHQGRREAVLNKHSRSLGFCQGARRSPKLLRASLCVFFPGLVSQDVSHCKLCDLQEAVALNRAVLT